MKPFFQRLINLRKKCDKTTFEEEGYQTMQHQNQSTVKYLFRISPTNQGSESEAVIIKPNHVSINRDVKVLACLDTEQVIPSGTPCYYEVHIHTQGRVRLGMADPTLTHVVIVSSNGYGIPRMPVFGAGDTVGCGVTATGRIFFTVNGMYIGSTNLPYIPEVQTLKPVLYLGNGVSVSYNFGTTSFAFEFRSIRVPTIEEFVCDDVSIAASAQTICTIEKETGDGTAEGASVFVVTHVTPNPGECVANRERQVQIIPPLHEKHPQPYVEVRLVKLPPDTTVSVGLAEKFLTQEAFRGLTGWRPGQIGFHTDDGNVYCGTGKPFKNFIPDLKAKPGDVVGCGLDAMLRLFFTFNGKYIGEPISLPHSIPLASLCFTVGVDQGTSVRIHCAGQGSPYLFNPRQLITTRPATVCTETFHRCFQTRDVVLYIFSFLTVQDLHQVILVNKNFHEVGSSDDLWSMWYMKHGQRSPEVTSNFMIWYYHDLQMQNVRLDQIQRMVQDLHRYADEISREQCQKLKPVIYLYFPVGTQLNVTVRLPHSNQRVASWYAYPPPSLDSTTHRITWKDVIVREDNTLEVASSHPVPYLFWESTATTTTTTDSAGDVIPIVKGDAPCIPCHLLGEYLLTTLPLVGLRRLEISDFMTFWLSFLLNHPRRSSHVHVHMLSEDAIDERVAVLQVKDVSKDVMNKEEYCSTTCRDEMIRVYVVYQFCNGCCCCFGDTGYVDAPRVARKRSDEHTRIVEWGGSLVES